MRVHKISSKRSALGRQSDRDGDREREREIEGDKRKRRARQGEARVKGPRGGFVAKSGFIRR